MEDPHLALRFAVALGLGVLIGLERERAKGEEGGAGVRTFALIALAGALAGYLEQNLGMAWVALAVFVAVGALVISLHVLTSLRGDTGIATEISALLAFLLGMLCARGQLQVAAWVAVAMALMLALKDWLHRLARRIDTSDIEATLKFAIVTLIVLPLVPDQNYGPAPLDVLNPYRVWLMVVLISGLNFASYLLIKTLGAEHGIGIAGLLGGLASSTAVTLGFSQRSRQPGADAPALALGILLAWTVMFFRVVVMAWLISGPLGARLAVAMGVLCAVSLGACVWLWHRRRARERGEVQPGQNPFELDEAIKFGLLFGVVVFVAKAAEVYLGEGGLYLAAGIAGLSDVDAITLAMADQARNEAQSLEVAARAIVIAALANTLVKSSIAATLGSAELRRVTLPISGLLFAAGALAAALV
ncbi:MAG: MgtC/SapB family protein [Betaproteobacteria bacterium]|nr:MgtC/SapB family protein [Betaproteobacteria bacterium]